jgi:tRNA pseudouridine13 synthase
LTADAGIEQERRSLRLAVRDLTWEREANAIMVRFRLMRGSFATMVLREIVDSAALDDEDRDAS